ncbi:MAG: hypothetical protein BM564_07745 [Bacteroidetes bacterium MedPE-SWsnd-G2]|nr:MAG: hypothetical protein BM564_07745 [Bacteroidetes bacterium MedPE-SWsnd-G2]
MTLELIIFIASILFGVLLYWRESQNNGLYRSINRILNSKELQMSADDKTGFVYKQKLLMRVVYIGFLFLGAIIILQFVVPIGVSYNSVSVFVSLISGTLIGTYIANFVLKSGKVIEENSDHLEDVVEQTVDKVSGFVEDLRPENKLPNQVPEKEEKPEAEKKSARERLKDKGLM